MINHARTLLMNTGGSSTGFAGFPGEEFIPPTFISQTLPGPLEQVWRVLYGSRPDRYLLNYRTRELMGLLHSTELQELVTSFDPRITYDVLPDDDLFDGVFVTQVTNLGGTTSQLFLAGQPVTEDASGRLYNLWTIEVVDSDIVRVKRASPPLADENYEYFLTSGLSNRIRLPNSMLDVRFQAGVGSRWRVEAVARPRRGLQDIFDDLTELAGAALPALFARATPYGRTEPMLTCWNLWHKHPQMPYRLAGLLGAWLLQAESLRTTGKIK